MGNIQLDYSDIKDIFKEKLKIDNIVKTVDSIFLNERYSSKINYKPYFQRNYVWDDEKATYFIESILLGTEIPPIVLFQTKEKNEVIDGRQRYETIERFLNDKLVLSEKGLRCLKALAGKRYSQIDGDTRDCFEDTRIRILQFQVVNEPKLDDEKEDKIKKEIFRRYNSGITPLGKYDIERAAFIDDDLTQKLTELIEEDSSLYNFLRDIMVPKRKMKAKKRDQVNILTTKIRDLLSLPMVPIKAYAGAKSKAELLHRAYSQIATEKTDDTIKKFRSVVDVLKMIYIECQKRDIVIKNNKLFYEVLYWGVSIVLASGRTVDSRSCKKICENVQFAEKRDIWSGIGKNGYARSIDNVFDATGSHYYLAIVYRYTFMANIIEKVFGLPAAEMLNNHKNLSGEREEEVANELERYKLNKPLPETLTIEDIVREMQRSRFLIRPQYQRSETKDLQKASYLMESILLGFTIPPIFVYKRQDKVREVVDGQQRLLTILGFLGKTYLDENGENVPSDKDRFKLSKLKILSEQDGKTISNIGDSFEDSILEFPLDVIEIDGEQNPGFRPIDLFLRLNTKPYPISENSFEMWNAYIDKEIVSKAKEIAEQYHGTVFRNRDNRMKLEEHVTSLAYLDYRITKGADFSQIVNVYMRNERISARIMSKDQITKTLGEVSINNVEEFLQSFDQVDLFAKKILAVVEGDTEKIRELMNHSKKGTNYKTAQNYYYLWLLLRRIPIDYIQVNPNRVFNEIRKVFSIIQRAPQDLDVADFVRQMAGFSAICEDANYSFPYSL